MGIILRLLPSFVVELVANVGVRLGDFFTVGTVANTFYGLSESAHSEMRLRGRPWQDPGW